MRLFVRFLIVVGAMLILALPVGSPEGKFDKLLSAPVLTFGLKVPAVDGADRLFPKGFMWGIATSRFQDEGGCGKTDWEAWYAEKGIRPSFSGFSEEDILRAKAYGVRYIRTSLEWACIEPAEGVWDEAELDRSFRMAKFAKKNERSSSASSHTPSAGSMHAHSKEVRI